MANYKTLNPIVINGNQARELSTIPLQSGLRSLNTGLQIALKNREANQFRANRADIQVAGHETDKLSAQYALKDEISIDDVMEYKQIAEHHANEFVRGLSRNKQYAQRHLQERIDTNTFSLMSRAKKQAKIDALDALQAQTESYNDAMLRAFARGRVDEAADIHQDAAKAIDGAKESNLLGETDYLRISKKLHFSAALGNNIAKLEDQLQSGKADSWLQSLPNDNTLTFDENIKLKNTLKQYANTHSMQLEMAHQRANDKIKSITLKADQGNFDTARRLYNEAEPRLDEMQKANLNHYIDTTENAYNTLNLMIQQTIQGDVNAASTTLKDYSSAVTQASDPLGISSVDSIAKKYNTQMGLFNSDPVNFIQQHHLLKTHDDAPVQDRIKTLLKLQKTLPYEDQRILSKKRSNELYASFSNISTSSPEQLTEFIQGIDNNYGEYAPRVLLEIFADKKNHHPISLANFLRNPDNAMDVRFAVAASKKGLVNDQDLLNKVYSTDAFEQFVDSLEYHTNLPAGYRQSVASFIINTTKFKYDVSDPNDEQINEVVTQYFGQSRFVDIDGDTVHVPSEIIDGNSLLPLDKVNSASLAQAKVRLAQEIQRNKVKLPENYANSYGGSFTLEQIPRKAQQEFMVDTLIQSFSPDNEINTDNEPTPPDQKKREIKVTDIEDYMSKLLFPDDSLDHLHLITRADGRGVLVVDDFGFPVKQINGKPYSMSFKEVSTL